MPKRDQKLIDDLIDQIGPWLSRRELPPPYVDKDIARLHKFVTSQCIGRSAADSAVVREALLLLHRIQEWSPYWSLHFEDRPGPVKFSQEGIPYVHHWTLQDEETAGGRPMLISGGAFEMNRRRH